jgi:hypothetical protein
MASDIDDNIIIETSGLTAAVATDVVQFAGATAHFQLIKLAHGICGAANIVSSSSPLPVTIASGMTATISGFTGTIQVQGVVSGYPVAVSGTVTTTGLSASPVYVTTASGSRVEITGGIPLTKTKDAISVFGPSGSTYIYTLLVDQAGNSLSYTNGALNVNISGATISATIPSTVTVVGLSGATAVNVSVGNTANINDTNILTGMTAIYGQVVGLRTDLSALGVGRATAFKTGRASATSSVAVQMDASGYTTYAGINIRALSTNTDFVYLGNTGGLIGASYGYALDPGENVFLDIQNTNKIYVISNSGTQVITYMAS